MCLCGWWCSVITLTPVSFSEEEEREEEEEEEVSEDGVDVR